MSKICTLIIHDQCNASFVGLDPTTRRECSKTLKYFIHAARHTAAYRLGRWDGCVSFFAINGNTYVNLIDRVLPIIADRGYEIELDDRRPDANFEFVDVTESYLVDNFPDLVWGKGHPSAGQPILLRDYQVDVIRSSIENLQSVSEIATGSGKTIMCAVLSHLCEDYGRSIVIVPNKDLVRQTEADYKHIGLDVGVYFGDRKEYNRTHTICTWQSLSRLADKTDAVVSLDEFAEGVVAVIVDEVHMATADKLKELLTKFLAHIPIRWGLSGTIPKEEYNATSILSSLGPTVKKLAAKQLMDIGVLAKCHVNLVQMQDVVSYATFHDENNYLVTDRNRLEWISKLIKTRARDGNTLVLVNRIETGKELHSRIIDSVFLSGTTKLDLRKTAYNGMTDNDNDIIIATYGIAAVGINIPRIFNLVMIEPGKSFVRVIQSIGRSIRIAKDKDSVHIFDIASTCKFSARHVTARKKFYKSAEYPFTVEKIDYIDQLAKDQIEIKDTK